ncbi:hypothetical protein [Luteimonas sp. R10]|uniref:hypothetical protein n=1 Tax=Luteimonas sp. R10 TaxID=3108176 RepID=UPI003085A3BE|nr:hypothetical protein U3649_12850 [Luteimonas sp. R10]
MNRKLHNTILAFSVTGGMLLLGFMAAVPVPRAAQAAAAPTQNLSSARAEALEARTRAFEAELGRAGSANEMIALSSVFLAEIVAEAAVASALQGIEQDTTGEGATGTRAAERKRGNGRKRNALALPYFSFAHGLRGSSGS